MKEDKKAENQKNDYKDWANSVSIISLTLLALFIKYEDWSDTLIPMYFGVLIAGLVITNKALNRKQLPKLALFLFIGQLIFLIIILTSTAISIIKSGVM